jgi:hypothetical protein
MASPWREWRSLDGIPLVVPPGQSLRWTRSRIASAVLSVGNGGARSPRTPSTRTASPGGITASRSGSGRGSALRPHAERQAIEAAPRTHGDRPADAEGMQRGLDLARNGALQARARELAGEHSSRAARAGELKVHGRQLGTDRAERYRADGRPGRRARLRLARRVPAAALRKGRRAPRGSTARAPGELLSRSGGPSPGWYPAASADCVARPRGWADGVSR